MGIGRGARPMLQDSFENTTIHSKKKANAGPLLGAIPGRGFQRDGVHSMKTSTDLDNRAQVMKGFVT